MSLTSPLGGPRIITVAAQKGGVGKTTAVLNLAAVAAAAGFRVLVVDTDAQASADWWADRAGEGLPFQFAASTDPGILRHLATASDIDLIYVDTPGHLADAAVLEACLDASHYAICPMEPAALSLRPVEQTIATLIRPRGLAYRVLLSRIDGRHSADNGDMRALLTERGVPAFTVGIREYAVHRRAPIGGLVVTQYPTGLSEANALSDFQRVHVELLGDLATTGTRVVGVA